MPIADDATLLEAYAGKGVLLDSNLLLLLVVGTYDRSQVGKFKRLIMFVPEDFDILRAVVSRFRNVYVTPNTVTEVSNLAGSFSGDARKHCFRSFAATILASEELIVPSADAAQHFAFEKLGITDAAIFSVAGNPPLVLTTDFPLSQSLAASGLPVINFNHLRFQYWN